MNLFKLFSLAVSVCLLGMSSALYAQHHEESGWQLVPEESQIAYGSIKANVAGEVNTFKNIDGAIAADGLAMISIDLASVETNVDVRNQRMIKYIFGDNTKAVLTTQIDMTKIQSLKVGDTTELDVEGVLSFLGQEVDVDTRFFIVKLSDTRVMASSESMIMMPTEELGINAGIDTLMALAKLPSITRVTPITLRFVFELDK
jgi:hypothetical protein